ncbi:MAG: acyl-CoA thioesterase [Geobacteraceae bacterium]|nr:acyl-CoA thioesterase [Geobacteraceae bacterium]
MKYHETRITVRFNEIDSYQVAWHGHYVAWMEIGRNDLAGRFDMNAFQLATAGYLGPVVALELTFLRPARFNEELTIRTTLRRTETATLEFITTIVGSDGKKCATGSTTHALTDLDGVLQFQLPPLIAERVNRLLAALGLP